MIIDNCKLIIAVSFFIVAAMPIAAQHPSTMCNGKMVFYEKENGKDAIKYYWQNEINPTDSLRERLIVKANAYLQKRTGSSFYSFLYLLDCEEFSPQNRKYYKEQTDKRVKYCATYLYNLPDSMSFLVAVFFDKGGKIFSANIPNVKKNPAFWNIISLCQGHKIGTNDTLTNIKSEETHLEYSKKDNAFVWVVEKGKYIGNSTTMYYSTYVNAQTGKVLRRTTRKRIYRDTSISF